MNMPALSLSSGHDPITIRVVYAYLASATFWLLIGTAYGLLAAIKLYWPDFLAMEWLSFGRIRPIHTSTVLFGWSTLALVGLGYYIAYRTSQVSIWRPQLATVALWLWNLAILCGLITLSVGINTGPQEYREWVWPVALLFASGLWWLQTIAILFSVGMMVPVWSGAGNFFLTVRGSWGLVRRSYALLFLLVGVWGYALASTQGTIEAFRTAHVYWHFTNFTVGHAHLTMYGFVAFLIWGAIYGLLPRITGRHPTPRLWLYTSGWLFSAPASTSPRSRPRVRCRVGPA